MKNVLGICSHDQLHLDTLHFAEPSLLKRIRQLNPSASYLVFRRSTGVRVVSCVLASPCMCMMSRLYALASLTMRSARRSRMVYVYVPGTLAPELLGWPRTVCGFLCVFSALVNQQGQPHPQSMDSMKGLSEFEDLQYTSYHATIGGSAVDVLLHHRLR